MAPYESAGKSCVELLPPEKLRLVKAEVSQGGREGERERKKDGLRERKERERKREEGEERETDWGRRSTAGKDLLFKGDEEEGGNNLSRVSQPTC